MYKKIICLFMILVLSLSMPVSAYSSEYTATEGILEITNIDESIPRSSIVSQEIIYISGIPVLFESYIYNDHLVDIGSLLEKTPEGYRVVRSGREVSLPMPKNFLDLVLATHNEIRQINAEGIDLHRSLGGGHHTQTRESASRVVAGVTVPGTVVSHWFDWQIRSVVLATDVWVGSGGMRATPIGSGTYNIQVANISLTENISINRLAFSFSFPPGFGGLAPNMRTRTITGHDVLFLSSTRGSFQNTWYVPTFGLGLVAIETMASSGVRVGGGIMFGDAVVATVRMASMG